MIIFKILENGGELMRCPTCGWGVSTEKEYEENGMVIGVYRCNAGCPVEITVVSPLEFMVKNGKWNETKPSYSRSEE